jgi:hypothetical protein
MSAHPLAPAVSLDVAIATPGAPMPTGLLDGIEALLRDLRSRARDQLRLAVLEAQCAAESLGLIVVLGLAVGIVLGAACLAATGAVVLRLVESGVAPSAALLLGAGLLLLGATGLAALIRRCSRALRFQATMRSLGALDDARDSRA